MRLARLWGRADDGGGESAVVDPSVGAAFDEAASDDVAAGGATSPVTLKLQLTLWEQWA